MSLLCWIGDDGGGECLGEIEGKGILTLDGIGRAFGVKAAIWLLAFSEIEVWDVLVICTLMSVRYGEVSICVTGWPTTEVMEHVRFLLC